ncbi:hypothetical protein E6B08_17470 [Pseudomonas putida]|uniref:Uncharacterized protein n=1 Tax=Pseudomonas putida TaxID=303 RepID=A0A4D6XEA8_PSEPU|nr:hypothetical protein [Pseudomonas putida]QCI13050.1 hypothetical protein E6B08_17470 [Pseudomonas putida]
MQRLYEQQRHLASVFVAGNQDLVASVAETAVLVANEFLEQLASKILLPNALTNLQTLAQRSKIEVFGLRLRQHACEFSQARASSTFWELVDALSALGDATGTQWPYMTQDVRFARLGHAREHLDQCSLVLSEEASKFTA